MTNLNDKFSKIFKWVKESSKPDPKPKPSHNKSRTIGDKNEKIAQIVSGLNATAGSGCGFIEKGDLVSDHIFLEAKATSKSKIYIKESWWIKAKQQAKETGKTLVLLQVAFETRHHPVLPHLRWVGYQVDSPCSNHLGRKSSVSLSQTHNYDRFSVEFDHNIILFISEHTFFNETYRHSKV
jgi:hypothetical protein